MSRSALCFDRVRGCLLGGAVGDALGAPLEFLGLAEIRARFGPEGLTDFAPAYGRIGAITDDSQLALFTAEGLVLAARAGATRGEAVRILHRAYLRWLRTQGEHSRHPSFDRTDEGWLLDVPALHARRAPGRTCLAALRGARMGRLEHPSNASQGCGGVMRVAPVGLAAWVDDPFRLGCQAAALTHGHPSGYLAAGFLALTIRELAGGMALEPAVGEALEELRRWPGSAECAAAVESARVRGREGRLTPEGVESLGGGWVAPEALAISLACALAAPDFASAVRLAVNHGGDSDSTGAITGQLVGAWRGTGAIPGRWRDGVELREEFERAAHLLHASAPGRAPPA